MGVYPPVPAGLSREKHVARLSLKSPQSLRLQPEPPSDADAIDGRPVVTISTRDDVYEAVRRYLGR